MTCSFPAGGPLGRSLQTGPEKAAHAGDLGLYP